MLRRRRVHGSVLNDSPAQYKRHALPQALLFSIKSYTFYIGIAAAVGTGTSPAAAAAAVGAVGATSAAAAAAAVGAVGAAVGATSAAAAAADVGTGTGTSPAAADVGTGPGVGTGSQRWLLNLSFSQVGGEN
ncbi:hypothetical protein MP228_006737 [Amoeboaphelidium protococcarum]|nr:hypothetical protein MP228_006737 [Amoeboaphelidium protococcarum]